MTGEPERRPGVPPAVRGLGLVSLFNDFASEMVYPLLPAFVTRSLGGGAVALGVLDGAADLTSALLKWVSGRWADRGWRKPLILGGYGTAVLVRPLIALAGSAWQVVGFRVLDRVGKGLRTPARDALIADVTPPASRGRAYGFHRAADHLGAVAGSLAAWLFLTSGADVRQVIGWSAAPGVVAFLVLAVVLRGTDGRRTDVRRTDERRTDERRTDVRRTGGRRTGERRTDERRADGRRTDGRRTEPRFWPPVLALALLALVRLPEALLLLRLQDLGVPVAAVPLLWAGLHVVRSGGSYPGGRLTDRVGPRGLVAAGTSLFAVAAAALALPLAPWTAGAAFLGLGLVAGFTEPAERALVARLSPRRPGRGFGAFHAVTGLAALPAGLLFGAVYQRLGGPAALGGSAAATLGGVLLWLAVAPAERGVT